MPPLTFWIYFT